MGLVGIPAGLPSVTVGGRTFTDLTNLITISNYGLGANYSTMRKSDGTNYTPSGIKKLRILAFKVKVLEAGNGIREIGYGDTAVTDSAAAPTNAVIARLGIVNATALDNTSYEFATNIEVPNGKYPYVRGCFVAIYGYEE